MSENLCEWGYLSVNSPNLFFELFFAIYLLRVKVRVNVSVNVNVDYNLRKGRVRGSGEMDWI